MNGSAAATEQLRHLLTIAPPSASQFLSEQHRNNPVAVAHAALQALRDEGDENCLFLRTVMELSTSPLSTETEELFFHCVTGYRHVVLWQWKHRYSSHFLARLRDYFLTLGHHVSGSRTCRLACYTTAASFWKRNWNEEPTTPESNIPSPQEQALLSGMATLNPVVLPTKQSLFAYLETLVQQQQLHQTALFLDCLVSEFGGKSAVSYRLPLEFHKAANRAFDGEGALLQSLQLAVTALSQVVATITTSNTVDIDTALAVVQLTTSVLGWEFGASGWDTLATLTTQTLIQPPVEWKECIGRVEYLHAIFRVHEIVTHSQEDSRCLNDLGHLLRQLLLQLASLKGPIFAQAGAQQQYASFFCEGTLHLLQQAAMAPVKEESSVLGDTFQIISRLIVNFRLALLIELPTFAPLLQCLTVTGNALLLDHLRECEEAGGDVECMEHNDWREEALSLLLECAVLLCGDPWLLYGGTEESRRNAQASLSTALGQLFEGFVRCRTYMAALEERFLVTNETELDEVREEILETGLEEEMESIAAIGRLHLSAAIACLSTMFETTMPRLHVLWDTSGEITPEASALLEEARLLTAYVSYLLTDNNEGESPSIPDAVMIACQGQEPLVASISSAVLALLQLADSQVQKISKDPLNRRLSPLLARTFLSFLIRWAPAYIYPVDYGSSNASNLLVQAWSTPEKANQAITLCISLCLNYQCYWPQERLVQESVGKLLLSLAKRGGHVRSLMVASPAFHDMVRFHCLTAGFRHSAPQSEFEPAVQAEVGGSSVPSMTMIWGYQRLPYEDRARVLTAILVACSDTSDEAANIMINDSLKAIHEAFTLLVNALTTKQVDSDDVNAREMACLCVEMFCGVAQASEMADSERIPQLVTSYLPQLSVLMTFYAKDLTVCQTLLRFFRDYTANFIAVLDRDQSLVLFQSCAELLKSYSANHFSSRVINKKSTAEAVAEEEQSYGDILFAVQLLINLGTKDFIDACNSQAGVESTQVTGIIFFGLQQILPLMTQGLLQYPTLCSQFFELVGFMMDTYPEKVCALPFELFDSLLESLLFGVSHQDAHVSKCCLHGLASIAREHLNTGVLMSHLDQHPDIFDRCSRRLLSEVVFQTVVVDRVEAAGMALLPLAACDVNRFAALVRDLSTEVPDPRQRTRLEAAFSKLIQPEVLAKASVGGYEGRMNRVRFKRYFEEFVNEVHAFLVLR
jgi:hypothetical protein